MSDLRNNIPIQNTIKMLLSHTTLLDVIIGSLRYLIVSCIWGWYDVRMHGFCRYYSDFSRTESNNTNTQAIVNTNTQAIVNTNM